MSLSYLFHVNMQELMHNFASDREEPNAKIDFPLQDSAGDATVGESPLSGFP